MRHIAGPLAVLAALSSACTPNARVAERIDAAPPGSLRWVDVGGNDSLHVAIDTGTIRREGGLTTVWIALTDVRKEHAQAIAAPFRRLETRQELDCARQRARSLDIRTPDSAGVTIVSAVRDSTWKGFTSHAVGIDMLAAVCRALHSV